MLTDWMELGSCIDIAEPEKFFDLYLESEEVAQEIQMLCISCPVRIPCINYGIQTKSTGVWGGRWLQNGKQVKRLDTIVSDYYWKDEKDA